MRFGNRFGSLVLHGVLILAFVPWARGADPVPRAQPVPLGGVLADQAGDRYFAVYVPTRFGGELTIKTSSGTLSAIVGPDGRTRINGGDVGNQQGWYSFAVSGGTAPYTVETAFVQVGQSLRKPWNYYYWPTKSDSIHEPWAGGNARVDTMRAYGDDIMVATPGGYIAPGQDIIHAGRNGILETPVAAGDDSTWFPNEYDDLTFTSANRTLHETPAPMLKYDQVFHTSARAWEASAMQNMKIERWPGHCLGGAVASILLNEPVPAVPGMTKDELKALWGELGENHLNHRIGEFANNIPAGPPRPGFDECDASVAAFHNMLEKHIRGNGRALLANLRAFPPRGSRNEVWNHGVGKYTAEFHAIPGKGERAVLLKVAIEGNSGSCLNGQDCAGRIINYEYSLVYGLDGNVDLSKAYNCDWISVGGEALYAPLNMLQVTQSRWQGHNPYVNESNVRALDLANGGGGSRLAGAPRKFRSAAEYEGGSFRFGDGSPWSPYGAGPGELAQNRGDRAANTDSEPRRGLFRGFFGR